ncbi:MAG: nuclear transport factor 2 family protein [Chloroflexi bacterium]|nr:MAG: nuclear transport factor 2 family protein [Chloroflexota bacterium]
MTTTSVEQRNVELTKKGYQAFNEAHIEGVMDVLDDDVVWHIGGENPISGEYKGKEAVIGMFAKFAQLTEGTYEADVHDILASEEHTVVLGTYTATRRGRTRSARFVDVIHPGSDGKAKEVEIRRSMTTPEPAFVSGNVRG